MILKFIFIRIQSSEEICNSAKVNKKGREGEFLLTQNLDNFRGKAERCKIVARASKFSESLKAQRPKKRYHRRLGTVFALLR